MLPYLCDTARRTHLLTALILTAVLAAPAAAADPASGKAEPERDTFTSAGKPIAVERFEPAGKECCPAIVFLHAVDGLDNAYAGIYRTSAAKYAADGYVVVLPHYFDRTATREADVKAIRERFLSFARNPKPSDEERKAVATDFDAWTATVRDAVTYVRTLPNVDPERVALVGFSLGGFLALTVAAEEDQKISAVVDFFGGLPEERRARVKKLPPALIFHGDQDDVVPMKEAEAVRELMQTNHLAGEVKIYRGVGHMFMDEKGKVPLSGAFAAADAAARTSAHLAKWLKPAPAEVIAERSAPDGRER
jgi:carboxymethylenebutenolidase